jgi:hypothetical protein
MDPAGGDKIMSTLLDVLFTKRGLLTSTPSEANDFVLIANSTKKTVKTSREVCLEHW